MNNRGEPSPPVNPKATMNIEQDKITLYIKAGGQDRTVVFHNYILEGFQVTPVQGMIDQSMIAGHVDRPCIFLLKFKAKHHETDIKPEDITFVPAPSPKGGNSPQGNIN